MSINKINSKSIEDLQISADDLANSTVTSAKLSYPLTTFSSTGIDDNATSTAITIDSSGNLLVGKSSLDYTTAGTIIRSDGSLFSTTNGANTAVFERLTSDGDIIRFEKDNTTVGRIGYTSDGLYIDGESAHTGIRFGGAQYVPKDGGSDSDNGVDLGTGSARFKDLYLGGGLYVGGTGTANKLDDYEEGTFTPDVYHSSSNDSTWTNVNGEYTKIGNTVTCQIRVDNGNSGTAGSVLTVGGLPFTVDQAQSNMTIGTWGSNPSSQVGIVHGFNPPRLYKGGQNISTQMTFITIMLVYKTT